MKITDYQVVRREGAEELSAAVSAYINQGWELVGGVMATCSARHYQDRDGGLCCTVDWVWSQAIKRTSVG